MADLMNGTMDGSYAIGRAGVSPSLSPLEASNISRATPYMPDTKSLRQAVLIVYLAGFFFGLAGNSLVIGIIGYYKSIRIKSVANYYIWNLSLADLLFILTLPFFSYNTFSEDWPFGDIACKISFAFRETNRFCSVFILVALSWDRFIASYYNLSHFRTIKLGIIICIIIWVICATLSLPYWLYAGTLTNMRNQTSCQFNWPREYKMEYMKLWTYFQLILGLLLPFFMIVVAYILLSLRLKRMLSTTSLSSGVKKPSRKMTRTVAVVVTTFLICQTPYYLMEVWSLVQQQKVVEHIERGSRFIPSRLEMDCFIYLNAIAQMLTFISSSINPILYGLMNDNYRKLYRVVLCRCRTLSLPTGDDKQEVDVQVQSGTESEGQVAAVASVTYRFQITFHHPCVKKRKSNYGKRGQSTEQIVLEERTEKSMAAKVNI